MCERRGAGFGGHLPDQLFELFESGNPLSHNSSRILFTEPSLQKGAKP